MRKRCIALSVIGIFLTAGAAAAQTTTGTSNPGAGAFDTLSPGNQKIAQALFQAQQSPNPSGLPPLTQDAIAAAKLTGGDNGWGVLFKQWKEQGYFTQKNLGQVVKQSGRPPMPSTAAPATTITTGSGKTQPVGAGAATSAGGASFAGSGNGRGNPPGQGTNSPTSAGAGSSGGSAGRGNAAGHGK